MKKLGFTCLFTAWVTLGFDVAIATGGDGYDLMQRSERATKSRTEATRFRLELVDANGKLVQARDMTFHFKKLAGKEATLIRFLSPPALDGTGLLVEDAGHSVNDIWLYLPATRRLRRISGAEKTNWFMGTEFTHEDFEDYQLPLYRFELMDKVPCSSGKCQRVRATAVNAAERSATGYSSKVYSIDLESLYPVGIDYYGDNGRLVKKLAAKSLNRRNGYWRPDRIEMHNLENDRVTRLLVRERNLDGKLDDYLVSSRYLRADQ